MSPQTSVPLPLPAEIWEITPPAARALVMALDAHCQQLMEEVQLLRAQIFGPSSEGGKPVNNGSPAPQRKVGVSKKQDRERPNRQDAPSPALKRGRKALPPELKRVKLLHDIKEGEKQCGCGTLKTFFEGDASEQYQYVPGYLRVLRHVRPKYVCRQCQGLDDMASREAEASMNESSPTEKRGAVTRAPMPPQIIPRSVASASLLAHIIATKYVDSIPLYRQEMQFKRLGAPIGRGTMCGWLFKVSKACAPLMEILHSEVLSGPYLRCDETTVQVLKEPGRDATTESYMWLFRGGTLEKPAIEFQYDPTRESRVPKAYLKGYRGDVQTDGYTGYDFLDTTEGINHYGCLAHARRKFNDVIKATKATAPGARPGLAAEAMFRIRELYALEKAADRGSMSLDERRNLRQTQGKPLADDFHAWLKEKEPIVPPKTLLGKAVGYTLSQWSRLVRYLDTGHVRPDNNGAENAIRPFVVGRKNWLFSDTPEGAKASAIFYSLIETAKANGLEPYWYLYGLFEQIPLAKTTEDYRLLLPQYIDRRFLLPPTYD